MAITLNTLPWLFTWEGTTYRARACGRQQQDAGGLWEGWIEFDATDESGTLRSARETTQPNLTDLKYWSTGLTEIYLEGVLNRIVQPVAVPRTTAVPPPVFDRPAHSIRPAPAGPSGEAVLDPYSVYAKSPHVLMQELRALSAWHLQKIIRAYGLAGHRDVEAMTHPDLADLIMHAMSEAQGRSSRG